MMPTVSVSGRSSALPSTRTRYLLLAATKKCGPTSTTRPGAAAAPRFPVWPAECPPVDGAPVLAVGGNEEVRLPVHHPVLVGDPLLDLAAWYLLPHLTVDVPEPAADVVGDQKVGVV